MGVENGRAEKAREFVRRVVELIGLEASVETEEAEDHVLIRVEGADLAALIGPRGRTLNALQDIVNLAANRGEAEWRKILVDVGGYREERRQHLEEYAKKMAARAVAENMAVSLEAMNGFERRIVHLALAENPDVETRSEGEDPFRRVIIEPKEQERLPRPGPSD